MWHWVVMGVSAVLLLVGLDLAYRARKLWRIADEIHRGSRDLHLQLQSRLKELEQQKGEYEELGLEQRWHELVGRIGRQLKDLVSGGEEREIYESVIRLTQFGASVRMIAATACFALASFTVGCGALLL